MTDFISLCKNLIGIPYVLTDPNDCAPYCTDWRKRQTTNTLAVLRPASTQEVAQLITLCQQHHIAIVPQGGNTSLVLGSIPHTMPCIVLSLTRLKKIRNIDVINNSITVEAGCTLQEVQETAHEHKRLFPLSLASEGSCTIGGNLSTNAGGTAVLRYGNIRDLCLGIECVTSQGEIWNGLHNLRKDNTGYSLRNLFIGAEGTLGIITAATLKLYPLAAHQTTFLCAVSNIEQALNLFHFLQTQYDHHITSFECISDTALTLVNAYFPQFKFPFKKHSPYYLLIEISHSLFESSYEFTLETILATALRDHIMIDAIIAKSSTESKNLWALREHISLAQAKQGINIKHDISLPISSIPNFLNKAYIQLQTSFPNCQPIIFGHLGDGNLHYNISAPKDILPTEFIKSEGEINQIVYDLVHHYHGSIAAEHGIGTLKNKLLTQYKSTTELTLMRTIKNALDPHNLMNPGKLLPPDNENQS